MASQCYFNGDFWDATDNVAPGESPGTHPQKWRRLEIPEAFREFLVAQCQVTLLAGSGQHDKALAMRRAATDAMEEAVVRQARTNGRGMPTEVFTR